MTLYHQVWVQARCNIVIKSLENGKNGTCGKFFDGFALVVAGEKVVCWW